MFVERVTVGRKKKEKGEETHLNKILMFYVSILVNCKWVGGKIPSNPTFKKSIQTLSMLK